jgi:hypothetical protein
VSATTTSAATSSNNVCKLEIVAVTPEP